MKGTIKVKSEEGKGSRFIVTLPVTVDDHTDDAAPASFKQQLFRRRKAKKIKTEATTTQKQAGQHDILFVEDSPVAMMMVNKILTQDLKRC
jgi:hypothetical protein